MNRWKVRMTATELMLAAHVGSARNIRALQSGWTPVADMGFGNTWTANIEGAAGEMASAKALNIYYDAIVGDLQADDVGPYQVRTNISRRYDDTCLRPRDKPNRLYIGVLSFCPEYELVGWISGFDGKRDEWFRPGDPKRPPCFYVPREALHPMDELPRHPLDIEAACAAASAADELKTLEFMREVLN